MTENRYRDLRALCVVVALFSTAFYGCSPKDGMTTDKGEALSTNAPAGHSSGEAIAALPGSDSGKRYKLNPGLPHDFSKNAIEKPTRRVQLDELAPDFSLKTLDGKALKLSDYRGKAALFVFADTSCPCLLAYNDRLKALDAKFGKYGLRTVFVFSNGKTDTPSGIAKFVKEQNYKWPCALDLNQKVMSLFAASCLTETFLFDGKGRLRYHGRIDDDTFEPNGVRERDLQSAVVAVLDGRAVPNPETKVFACTIPSLPS